MKDPRVVVLIRVRHNKRKEEKQESRDVKTQPGEAQERKMSRRNSKSTSSTPLTLHEKIWRAKKKERNMQASHRKSGAKSSSETMLKRERRQFAL